MASTSRHTTTAYATRAFLLLLAMSSSTSAADVFTTPEPKGCYSSSGALTKFDTFIWQSPGHCQGKCAGINKPVFGLSNANECWCGNDVPDSKVDDTNCNETCDGYDKDICGGNGYWSMYTTGLEGKVPTDNDTPAPTKSAEPTVVTSIVPGQTTVVVTKAASPSSDSDSSSGGGTNGTAVAAGVVVAIVVVSGVLAGLFFWLRHRRRQAAEEEFKRTQIAEFMRSGDLKPPQTGYSSMSDSRLEPAFGDKRNSHGSIADNEDFSRKILRVANPDRS